MIFSEAKWKSEGIAMFVHASNALTWATMQAPLLQAWNMFLIPLLGDFSDVLDAIFEAEERNTKQKRVLWLCQNALANLALWYNFDELNTRLTDQGHQRQETENFKSLYKYQEDEIRNSYRNKGFNNLDALLEFLNRNVESFPEWTRTDTYRMMRTSIVRDVKEVNRVVFINQSNIIFLRMQPIFNEIEQTTLPAILGQRLYDEFCRLIKEDNPAESPESSTGDITTEENGEDEIVSDGEEDTPASDTGSYPATDTLCEGNRNSTGKSIGDTTVEELRIRVGRVIINLAAAKLIRQSGTITDRGLYFETLTPGKMGNTAAAIPGNREIVNKAMLYEDAARRHIQALHNFIACYIPDMFAGRPSDTFKRNNDNKRSVWL